jgi:hypothetical protein
LEDFLIIPPYRAISAVQTYMYIFNPTYTKLQTSNALKYAAVYNILPSFTSSADSLYYKGTDVPDYFSGSKISGC